MKPARRHRGGAIVSILAWTAAAAFVASFLCCAACSTPPRPPPLQDSDYPGWLRPPTALGIDILWQQHVSATWDRDEEQGGQGFDAAVQKQGDTLTLIGLSPLGSTGFVATLRGAQIDYRNESGEDLPIPPRFMLLDVQRVFFPWLAPHGQVLADGESDGIVEGEHVVEIVKGGRVVERRFSRIDGQPPGIITMRCEWGRSDWHAPSRAELDNGWFGYRLTIDTFGETLLPAGVAAPAASR